MAIYQAIAQKLQDEIREQFQVGEYLPPEHQLADRFSINRHTLRRAVEELIQAGMLERQHGRGTLVLNNCIEYEIGARGRFSEALENMGLHPSTEVLDFALMEAGRKEAHHLGIAPGAGIVRIDTLRRADGRPMTLLSHYLIATRVPDIQDHYQGGSLHAVLESVYGLRLQRQQSFISAALPRRDEIAHLCCARHQPLLIIRSRNVIAGTREVVEYSISRCRADRFELRVTPDPEISP
ncbi:phosphonate metabolism transcriptional regulator PhnF [Marinobacter fonticola]|uniref:phosphonate metabolism transcriptional regulator PhnF n=1 Tax=Marinobacter fonticola TaxID=2603215 RepID=UPI0011E71BDF|nr:phosphonate metabolism transcriptional regulator PhnF [Marinobacter fonticola]